ncbi:class I SAM-dependent methyltransferase [Deinococcus deserti]|uniref:Putative Methyltransferase n=1 Tax=Deinococcus deserti (strain DSM 17065 / CIP 109153 / LMG 22923 / VCD115) TaxID=546414 RepID=C1CZB1_DEIDV|nr:class I SAM-dependent methyltransferase [Deinococcus deserti]ACO45149.1 putative Methyltransferase [Deinococcus deserti VCD115]
MTLAARDALCFRLGGENWPAGPLLELLDLPTTAAVLDVGAGTGLLLRELEARGHAGTLDGIDTRPGAGVRHGQAEALPYLPGSFDAALLVRVLSHLPRPLVALAEAQRVLRPGGQLVLAAHGPGHLASTWRALGRPGSDRGPDAPLREALQAAALVAVRLDVRVRVKVTEAHARELVQASALRVPVSSQRFPVEDALHLSVYVARFS